MFKHRGKRFLVLIVIVLFVLGNLSACKKEETVVVFDVDKLKDQCNALTLQAVEGDASPIFEMIKEDYKNGTSLEGFQEYLDTRLRQADDFEEIIKSEFTQGQHPLEKYSTVR